MNTSNFPDFLDEFPLTLRFPRLVTGHGRIKGNGQICPLLGSLGLDLQTLPVHGQVGILQNEVAHVSLIRDLPLAPFARPLDAQSLEILPHRRGPMLACEGHHDLVKDLLRGRVRDSLRQDSGHLLGGVGQDGVPVGLRVPHHEQGGDEAKDVRRESYVLGDGTCFDQRGQGGIDLHGGHDKEVVLSGQGVGRNTGPGFDGRGDRVLPVVQKGGQSIKLRDGGLRPRDSEVHLSAGQTDCVVLDGGGGIIQGLDHRESAVVGVFDVVAEGGQVGDIDGGVVLVRHGVPLSCPLGILLSLC